jgi:S1-C subfamily serine protease
MRSLRPFLLVGCWLPCLLALLSSSARAGLVDTIERVKPSIVMVGTFDPLGSPQFILHGTGFVVGDGHVVATNAHVIVGDGQAAEPVSLVVEVRAAEPAQAMRTAHVWMVDKVHDLALLKVDGAALPALKFGDSDTVKEGLEVAFIGFPIGNVLGFAPVTHHGMVSAVTPIALPSGNSEQLTAAVIRRLKSGAFNILQLDATAYPGNSGGPLFDVDTGEVIGIINMVLVKRTKEAALSHPSGISYAIPANYLRDLLARIKGN